MSRTSHKPSYIALGFMAVILLLAMGGSPAPSVSFATLSPDSKLELPWNPEFNALAYVLSGSGTAGTEGVAIREGQLAVFGPGDAITLSADHSQDSRSPNLDVLILGGKPIREPVFFHGPFVMTTRQEVLQAVEDYHAGRLGAIPASYLGNKA